MITGYSKTIVKLPDGSTMPLTNLLGPLPAELKPLCQKLRPRVEKLNETSVRGYFEIGQLIQKELVGIKSELARNGHSSYGRHLFEYLGTELDIHERTLRDCHLVAERLSSDEYQALVVANGLSWGHARHLALVSDAHRREQIVKQIVKDKMPVEDLVSLIRHQQPKKPRGPGRSPAKPRGLRQAVDRLRSGSKAYQNTLGSLFGAAFDILTKIQDAPPDSLTQQTRDDVAESDDLLAAVEKTVQIARQRLKVGLERIDECIAAQAEHEKSVKDGEDEAQDRRRGRRTPARAR